MLWWFLFVHFHHYNCCPFLQKLWCCNDFSHKARKKKNCFFFLSKKCFLTINGYLSKQKWWWHKVWLLCLRHTVARKFTLPWGKEGWIVLRGPFCLISIVYQGRQYQLPLFMVHWVSSSCCLIYWSAQQTHNKLDLKSVLPVLNGSFCDTSFTLNSSSLNHCCIFSCSQKINWRARKKRSFVIQMSVPHHTNLYLLHTDLFHCNWKDANLELHLLLQWWADTMLAVHLLKVNDTNTLLIHPRNKMMPPMTLTLKCFKCVSHVELCPFFYKVVYKNSNKVSVSWCAVCPCTHTC